MSSNYPRDMIVIYGCPPPEPTTPSPQPWPIQPVIPQWPVYTPTHDNCSKCNRHIRIGEVCPWCHAEAVKEALTPKKPETKRKRRAAGSRRRGKGS